MLEHAAGFAIFTVVKAGFLVSARAGAGVVIARLDDGSECARFWSRLDPPESVAAVWNVVERTDTQAGHRPVLLD